ncbi:MAG: hypothetical protein WC210_08465 [Candidatus Neomarinimicrobiota bacterium]
MESLESILQNLFEAETKYRDASQKVSFARNEETTALNELNTLQKKFDTYVKELKKNAPRSSDWHRRSEMAV